MILFLDFDGVLHPSNPLGAVFTGVPLLAQWLQAWPQVDVVVSSSWRMAHPQHELVEMLGPVVGARLVGCTLWDRPQRDEQVYPAAKTNVFGHERQRQIEAWMASSWEPERAWVALDDMPFLFEADCGRLVVCPGRHGLSSESLRALDRHAQRAGLTRSTQSAGCETKPAIDASNEAGQEAGQEAEQESRMQTFDTFVKHTGSCLPDAMFRVTVDRERRLVTIASDAFDSALVGWFVTRILPDRHGVVAYRDDEAGWMHPPAPYALRVRIGGPTGIQFGAQVVRLASGLDATVAVRLGAPEPLSTGEG